MKKKVFVSFCLLLSAVSFSGTLSVKNIAFTVPAAGYYQAGYLSLAAGGNGDIQLWSDDSYLYTIDNLMVSLTPCQLMLDRSTPDTFSTYGGFVIGDFAGGATLTLTGDLRLNSDPVGSNIYSGTLLEADMDLSVSETWILQQTDTYVNKLVGAMDMSTVGGALDTGISYGADTIRIGNIDFSISMFFPVTAQNFTQLDGGSISLAPSIQLSAAEVPEPATLILVGLGGLICSRRKK